MTAVWEQTWSTTEVADMLDVGTFYVQRWARSWHGAQHDGVPGRRFVVVDVMVLRAFVVVAGHPYGCGGLRAHLDRAEAAIRSDPRRWLAMTVRGACTFDQPKEALPWWEARSRAGDYCLRLIDLQPEQVPV